MERDDVQLRSVSSDEAVAFMMSKLRAGAVVQFGPGFAEALRAPQPSPADLARRAGLVEPSPAAEPLRESDA